MSDESRVKKLCRDSMKCPKCGTELEEDCEDSSEMICPKCGYGWSVENL